MLNKFQEVGDSVVQYDPGHAASPLAAVRFVLQASVSSMEILGGMLDGIEITTRIVATCSEV